LVCRRHIGHKLAMLRGAGFESSATGMTVEARLAIFSLKPRA
jgi:hypothetical protein